MLRIACLPRMTVKAAAALSDEPKAGRMLVNLALNDYFVREVSSDAGRLYQLHPLLREFLRNRAAESLPDAVSTAALRRAALLLRDAGQLEDAIALLVEAGQWNDVAPIVLDEADAMLAQGRSETLAGWLDMLPRELLDARATPVAHLRRGTRPYEPARCPTALRAGLRRISTTA